MTLGVRLRLHYIEPVLVDEWRSICGVGLVYELIKAVDITHSLIQSIDGRVSFIDVTI